VIRRDTHFLLLFVSSNPSILCHSVSSERICFEEEEEDDDDDEEEEEEEEEKEEKEEEERV